MGRVWYGPSCPDTFSSLFHINLLCRPLKHTAYTLKVESEILNLKSVHPIPNVIDRSLYCLQNRIHDFKTEIGTEVFQTLIKKVTFFQTRFQEGVDFVNTCKFLHIRQYQR